MSELTHFNEQGRAKMVDVTNKAVTHRTARGAFESFDETLAYSCLLYTSAPPDRACQRHAPDHE